MQQARIAQQPPLAEAIGEAEQQQHRGQGEAGPGEQRAKIASPLEADGDADLARSRAGQELAEGDDIGVVPLAQPLAPHHEGLAKIAQMGDRAAKAGESEAEKFRADFDQALRESGLGHRPDGPRAGRRILLRHAQPRRR